MAVLEPLMALLAIVAPLAFAGLLIEWMVRRRSASRPKDAPAASAQCNTAQRKVES